MEFYIYSFIRSTQNNKLQASSLLSNISSDPSSTSRCTPSIENVNETNILDSDIGNCFKYDVGLYHLLLLSRQITVSKQAKVSRVIFFVTELSSKICHPKVLNTYIPINYSNYIDEGIFDYSITGKVYLGLILSEWIGLVVM